MVCSKLHVLDIFLTEGARVVGCMSGARKDMGGALRWSIPCGAFLRARVFVPCANFCSAIRK